MWQRLHYGILLLLLVNIGVSTQVPLATFYYCQAQLSLNEHIMWFVSQMTATAKSAKGL